VKDEVEELGRVAPLTPELSDTIAGANGPLSYKVLSKSLSALI